MLELRRIPEADVEVARNRLLERAVARRVRTSYESGEEARSTASQALERSADDLTCYDVVDGDRVVGWLVWWHKGDQCEVNDLVLDDPARSAELLAPLLELARTDGCPALGVSTVPGEPARDALAAGEGFVRRATNMALPLDSEIGDPGDLELRPMTQEDFDAWLAVSTEGYIVELASAGMTEEAARKQGEEQMAELVPEGLESPGQSFFTGWVGETPVGTFWVSTERPMAFVYDIEVREDQRRKGYGEAMMDAGARWCRDRGHPALGLNVFGHNPGARALYDKLGYHVTRDFGTIDVGS
ncbi:MAG: GNAT family N-acetyltransferase [Nocardioides sp.]